jgi:hypothetical protein
MAKEAHSVTAARMIPNSNKPIANKIVLTMFSSTGERGEINCVNECLHVLRLLGSDY